MNEIKRCSISGVGFTLEKGAYNRLNDYLQSLRKSYGDNPDCDEILADIEARIAELILSAQSDPRTVVALPLIENIIGQLGSPEDISGDESKQQRAESRIPRRLYRDLENSKLGGVCAGLAKYFGVDAVWVRLIIFAPLILLFLSGIPGLWWCSQLGANLFGIFLLTYLILWFAIPGAKSARQKLEMEGETISASSIANKQTSTQEEQAKSSVATVVTTFGRVVVVILKAVLGLMLFPITAFVFAILITIVGVLTSSSGILSMGLGNVGNMAEVVGDIGVPLLVCSLLLVMVPAAYVGYLIISLLINRKPRFWVLLVTLLAWILLLLGVIFSGVNYVDGFSSRMFSSDSEVERILKKDDAGTLSRQIMDSLDAEPDAEQRAEIERLLNDPTAKSIDR